MFVQGLVLRVDGVVLWGKGTSISKWSGIMVCYG